MTTVQTPNLPAMARTHAPGGSNVGGSNPHLDAAASAPTNETRFLPQDVRSQEVLEQDLPPGRTDGRMDGP